MVFFAALALQQADKSAIVSVERIWDRPAHAAFTDLIEHKGMLYCAFREGSGHVPGAAGMDGTARVIKSRDGMNWESVALLAEAEVDLRDPKLSVFPNGRLMVIMGGSFYQGTTLLKREMRVSISDPATGEFSRLMRAHIDPKIATSTDWLWRVLWHDDTAYGVVYQPNAERQGLHLVKSRVGIDWKHVTELEIDGVGNETTLRMLPDGRMAALVRQDGSPAPAMFGTAKPPFTDWSWTSTGTRIGGPNFVVLPDGRLLASGREYTSSGARTMVGWIGKDGQFTKSLTLPSGGDTSYPGMVVRGDQLWLSYYSSHEGKTAIYLAVLRIDRL